MGVTSGKERVVTASFCGHRNAILFSYLSMWVGLNSKYSWIYVGFYSIALKQWWLCVKMWRNVSYSNENLLSSLQTSFSLVPKAMSKLVFRDCITVFIWLSPSTAKPSHHTTILNKFWVVFLHKQNGLIRVVLASLCPLQWRPLSNHEESHPRIGAMTAGHRKKATVWGQFDVSGVCAHPCFMMMRVYMSGDWRDRCACMFVCISGQMDQQLVHTCPAEPRLHYKLLFTDDSHACVQL